MLEGEKSGGGKETKGKTEKHEQIEKIPKRIKRDGKMRNKKVKKGHT